MHYGTEPPEIDHANGQRHDNRAANLRAASRSENNGNAVVRRASGTGVKGVFRRKNGYVVRFANQHVGSFRSLPAAKEAYMRAAVAAVGAFAYDGAQR